MSAQPEHVESIADFMRGVYAEAVRVDKDMHRGMRILRDRIAALEMAEDPDVRTDAELVSNKGPDWLVANSMDPAELLERLRVTR